MTSIKDTRAVSIAKIAIIDGNQPMHKRFSHAFPPNTTPYQQKKHVIEL